MNKERLREILDWHLSGNLNVVDDDCGCDEPLIEDWQKRMKHIGDQAFIEHLYDMIVKEIEGGEEGWAGHGVGDGDGGLSERGISGR